MAFAVTEKTSFKNRKNEKLLLVLLLTFVVLAFHQLVSGDTTTDFMPTIVGAFFYSSGVPPQFIYLLVIGLLVIRRHDIADAYHESGAAWPAILFLLPGICLFLWGTFVMAMDIIHVSFILITFGMAKYLSGKEMTRVILPLTLILALATPLPAVLINQIIFPLQLWNTAHSVWMLNAVGIPSLAMGDMISMTNSSSRFAESCTALGFALWLTIFALTYVYIFRITRWHAALLVLSAPMIAYAVNILRAFSLVLNPEMEVLTIHTLQGVVFFLIGFSLLYAVDTVLIRYMPNNSGEKNKNASPVAADTTAIEPKTGKLYVLICLFIVLFIISVLMPRWSEAPADSYSTINPVEGQGAWKLTANPTVNYTFLGSVRYSSTLYHHYSKHGEPVSLFIGTDNRLQRNRSLVSKKNAFQDETGLVMERSIIDLGPEFGQVVAIISDKGNQRLLTYHWYDGVDGIAKEIFYALLALDQSPLRREKQARVTRLTTFVELTPQGRTLAHQRLRTFLQEMGITR